MPFGTSICPLYSDTVALLSALSKVDRPPSLLPRWHRKDSCYRAGLSLSNRAFARVHGDAQRDYYDSGSEETCSDCGEK